MKHINKIKNTKGLNTIELVIICFIVIIMVCGLVDLTNIMKKQQAVSRTINHVCRTIAKQGGVRQSKVDYYAGEYFNSSSLYNDVKKSMNDAGVDDSNWVLSIKTPKDGTVKFSPNTNLTITEIGKDMEVTLLINYYWTLSARTMPKSEINFKPKGSNKAYRVATSTFKTRDSTSSNTDIR